MAFNLNEIRSQLEYGGYRPSHFSVTITNPIDAVADIKMPFMVKAAQIPTVNIGKIPVFYFGRPINVPGDRTFEEWQTTIINDEDFLIRNALETWSNAMNSFEGNIATHGSAPNSYKSTAIVKAYGKDGRVLREYQLNGLFPLSVQSLDLQWETTDQIAEFPVMWSFDDMEVLEGATGNAGGV